MSGWVVRRRHCLRLVDIPGGSYGIAGAAAVARTYVVEEAEAEVVAVDFVVVVVGKSSKA